MNRRRQQAGNEGERGFALLVMLGLIGIGSVGILLAVQQFVPPLADVVERAEQNLGVVQLASRSAFRRNGTFPADLTALAAVTSGSAETPWRSDPWGYAQDLDYTVLAAGVRARSRGVDRTLATGDDAQVDVAAETLVRVRQRCRLRLIRAVVMRSQYRYAPTMSAGEVTSLRAAMRDWAAARRQYLTADAPTRVTLQGTMNASANTCATLAAAHGCPAMPVSVTGAGGLMQQLAMPDTKAVDGAGRVFARDVTVGVLAVGWDAVGGTNDDM